jgi:hypothetical protein
MTKKAARVILTAFFAGLFALLAVAADQPLSADDVTLLLLGGSPSPKIIALVKQRGVSFKMNPDLAKKFHDAGASDDLIDALTDASAKAQAASSRSAESGPAAGQSTQSQSGSAPAAASQANGGASSPVPAASSGVPAASAPAPARGGSLPSSSSNASASNSQAADVNQRIAETLNKLTAPEATLAKPAAAKDTKELTDPSQDQIQKIIQAFAAKEKLFKGARDNYTYHQINKVEELGSDSEIEGVYEQEWDILFDDSGKRIERVTYAPADTLKKVLITEEDLNSFRNTQPFVLTTDELPEYEVTYMGHVKVDEITAFVFRVRPKEIQKGRQYFQGVVWVDDQDLQIVKSEGKPVPELKTRKGENLFPRFTTYREQIDGKFWFPTYTMADDTLYFSSGPVHLKEILRYTDYKQFKSKVRIVSATPTDQPNATTPPAAHQN